MVRGKKEETIFIRMQISLKNHKDDKRGQRKKKKKKYSKMSWHLREKYKNDQNLVFSRYFSAHFTKTSNLSTELTGQKNQVT